MTNTPPLSENYADCARLLVTLHNLAGQHGDESAEADELRDALDILWYKLKPEEIDRIRALSADLNTLEGETGRPADAASAEREQIAARLRNAEAKGDWEGALAIVRQYAPALSTQQIAFFRGVYWAHLGGPELSLPFLVHAARAEPRALPVFLLTLAQLGMFEEVARLVLAMASPGEAKLTIPDSLVRSARESLRLQEKLRAFRRGSPTPLGDETGQPAPDPRQIEDELHGLQSFMAMELATSAA